VKEEREREKEREKSVEYLLLMCTRRKEVVMIAPKVCLFVGSLRDRASCFDANMVDGGWGWLWSCYISELHVFTCINQSRVFKNRLKYDLK
jgi:hypothetical protein